MVAAVSYLGPFKNILFLRTFDPSCYNYVTRRIEGTKEELERRFIMNTNQSAHTYKQDSYRRTPHQF
jgi:hypothetical protein